MKDHFYPIRILIVDDDADTRRNMLDVLELDGYEGVGVGTAAAVLSRTDLTEFTAILLDRRLPDGTADEILPRIRALAPDVAIVIVTGFGDVQSTIAAFRLGATDYVLKPIDLDELRNRLGRIVAHRQTQESLRRSQEFSRSILDSLGAHIAVIDRDGVIIQVNTAWKQFMGSQDGKDDRCGVGSNYFEVCHIARGPYTTQAKDVVNGLKAVLEGRTDRFVMEYGCDFHEPPLWFTLMATPLGADRQGVVVSHLDITERMRVQQALADSQRRLQALFDATEDAIMLADDSGRFVEVNPAATHLTGYQPDELRSRTFCDLTPKDREEAEKLWQRFLIDHQQGGDFAIRRKDGRVVPVEYRAVAHIQPGLHLSVFRDVTERQRTEEELRAATRAREKVLLDLQARTEELRTTTQQLWQTAKLAAVGELAASIAHELNNPLGTVSLRIEGVLSRTASDDPRRRALEIVEQEVTRMAKLVSNLLNFSRAGREQVSSVHVGEEVVQALELIGHHLQIHAIQVRAECDPDTPVILADRQQLRQVFLNLFTNAADTMNGGGTLSVRVRSRLMDESRPGVVIEVSDTGVGIPPELLPRVTEPFFTTKPEGKGTGLGLAICRRIIQQHQGSMQIESQVGSGTTIRIVLPIKPDPANESSSSVL